MATAKAWKAAWEDVDEPTGTDEPPRKMRLEAPDLPAGQEVVFEVTQSAGGEPVGAPVTVNAVSKPGLAEAVFADWFHKDRVAEPVHLEEGGTFPPVTYELVASASGRRVPAGKALGYNDLMYLKFMFQDSKDPIADSEYTLHCPWGTLEGKTDGDGCVFVENLPPGGADVIVRHPDLYGGED
jgi:hypothetical protein